LIEQLTVVIPNTLLKASAWDPVLAAAAAAAFWAVAQISFAA